MLLYVFVIYAYCPIHCAMEEQHSYQHLDLAVDFEVEVSPARYPSMGHQLAVESSGSDFGSLD